MKDEQDIVSHKMRYIWYKINVSFEVCVHLKYVYPWIKIKHKQCLLDDN